MRFAKASLISPGQNSGFAVPAIAVSLFVFAYSARLGQASILVYYALWLPLVLVDYRRVLGGYGRYGWIFAFTVFACLSVFWSAAPSVTARASVQYLSHVVCALIAMRMVDTAGLVRGMVAGIGLVLVYSLLFGVYHFDPLDGTYSFVGAFASKNQLGLYASLGVYFCFAALFMLRERGPWRIVCILIGLLAGYALHASQSATSMLTTAAVIGVGLGLQVLSALSPRHRKIVFSIVVLSGGVAAIGALQGGAVDSVLAVFGKDSTLTGRTYLWQQGIAAAQASPLIGTGYQAYWVQGFSEAERLWEEFYIGSRSGFHFHNTFIETMVETGVIGLLLLCMVLLVTFCGHLRRLLSRPRAVEPSLLFGVAVLLVMRAFVEVDILNPYHVGSFLLYFAAGRLTTAEVRAPAGQFRLQVPSY
ncbi:O-antigen ligase family protein [Rhizobium sp. Root482]|uniref:O-antigen ligase family protein n=1 Tax=Rhizobium sp. Root482 TaxID=1736543 RepID=UPI0006FD06BC|nr:O-antigen ligase [Rhizobium sp. Root482]KQY12567.1 exopolysaccharide biosynthesis protein [Rhizobium sp. Root482]